MILPRGLTRNDFSAALADFSGVIGPSWVFTSDADLIAYRDEYSPYRGQPEELLASAAVCPERVEQVQDIVRIANTYRVPLWVISGGRNFGYGSAAPRLRGSVVLDLKRMNRILDVSARHNYALIEPGVSSLDLYRYIQDHGLKLWMDGPSPAWASVIGSSLEHGLGHSLLGDRWDCACGMEVVLPDGDILRTGMGAVPGTAAWQQYKWGFGPHIDGLFSQSCYGIVTKMGTRLVPEPATFLSCQVVAPNYEDIVPLIEIIRPLRQTGILSGAVNIRPVRSTGAGRNDPPSGWRVLLGLYGLEQVNDVHWQHIRDRFTAIAGVKFEARQFRAPYNPADMDWTDKWLAGIPSMSEMKRWSHTGMFTSQVLPFSGDSVWKRIQVLDGLFQEYGLRYFGGSMNAHHARCLIALSGVPLDDADPDHNRSMVALAKRLLADAGNHGWGPYREGTILMDEAMAVFRFNGHSLLRFHESLKDGLDPVGILAAGKSGIWPGYLRNF